MHTEFIYSNKSDFGKQDNPFVTFLLTHTIRITNQNGQPHFVLKDIIAALGYSPTSTQHLSIRCRHKKRIKILDEYGVTCVNIIPIEDVITLILLCRFRTALVIRMHDWILAHVYRQTNALAGEVRITMPPARCNRVSWLPKGKQDAHHRS